MQLQSDLLSLREFAPDGRPGGHLLYAILEDEWKQNDNNLYLHSLMFILVFTN